ncbi:MAG: HAMP domain-containing histidine kinase [Lachnospiraceae bacterium]|nr:HAMP domain-containing histidine kinase [Lachnospiraceae bacterium]
MKKQEHQNRVALTLLFTALVLAFMLLTLLIVGLAIYFLIQLEILTGPNHTVPSAARIIIIFVVANLVLGAGMTFFFGKIPMKPVNKLINQMNRLAAGDYKARLDYGDFLSKHPTIVELTDSFNRMASELQSTEMLRSDFINNFSHEFKTPIVSITGFAKLLRKGNLPEEKKEEYLRIIETESLRLSQMATNVLNLTKVENQTILTDITEFNLSEQIRSCILVLSEKWEQKEIEYIIDFDEYNIRANEDLLKQVWINLLGNAVKFSPTGGMIEVKITEQEDIMTVSIMNTGSEIAPEHQKNIFNKFYQADESHSSEGNGIGLAIVKLITELHDGTVSVSSGNGSTTFTVVLPKIHN